MPAESPEYDFNDLSRMDEDMDHNGMNGLDGNGETDAASRENSNLAKIKRTACVLCRKRKLRCDGTRPSCGTCSRLGHDCKYDEVRKKSGPKRGYVKALEARLAQVETMLKNQDTVDVNVDGDVSARGTHHSNSVGSADSILPTTRSTLDDINFALETGSTQKWPQTDPLPRDTEPIPSVANTFSWDILSLGLEEPLPTPEVINELNDVYFQKVHPSVPMIHRPRFNAAMDLPSQMRPPVCLRYAIWALAAGVTDKYENIAEHFYVRARKYLEIDEMRGHGESTITLAHCQSWILCAMYEFKNMYFPRAWMSTGRGVRLAQMLSLHRQDRVGLDVKQCLAPPRDWTEREERRRTFWLAYWCDRCSSIGTGWPMMIEEDDIMTNLPAPEEAFQNSRPQRTSTLQEALESKTTDFSPFSGSVIMATLFGRNLTHLHRPGADEREHDLNGMFWERHRAIDGVLLNISLTLPEHLRVPGGLPDPNVVFLNMCIHTSAICLHQAAIFKADKHRLPSNVAAQSKVRCLSAATEISNIMRAISHTDLSVMNPFMAFCLYVAARVFVQYLKARPKDQQIMSSLHFLLAAMHAMKRKNPLTESFLAQLEVDLESAGMANPTGYSSLQNMINKGFPEFGIDAHGPKRMNPPSTARTKDGCLDFISGNQGNPGDPNNTGGVSHLGPPPSMNISPAIDDPRQNMPNRQRSSQSQDSSQKLTWEFYRTPDSSLGYPSGQIDPFDTNAAIQMDMATDNHSTGQTASTAPSLQGTSPRGFQSSISDETSSKTDSSGRDSQTWQRQSSNSKGPSPVGLAFTGANQWANSNGMRIAPMGGFSPANSTEDHVSLSNQFMPRTPNIGQDASGLPQGWDLEGNGAVDGWSQLLSGMEMWENGAQRVQDSWAMGQGG